MIIQDYEDLPDEPGDEKNTNDTQIMPKSGGLTFFISLYCKTKRNDRSRYDTQYIRKRTEWNRSGVAKVSYGLGHTMKLS